MTSSTTRDQIRCGPTTGVRSQKPAGSVSHRRASGWKGAAGTAIKCSPTLIEFYRVLARRLADRGWLEWQFLNFDGMPVAAHLAIRFGRSLILPNIGYDEPDARLSPGNLLFRETLTRAFADECLEEVNEDVPNVVEVR